MVGSWVGAHVVRCVHGFVLAAAAGSHRIRLLEGNEQQIEQLRSDGLAHEAQATGTAGKVMQSRLSLFMLLHHPLSQQYLLLLGHVPCPLQVVDFMTAENTRETQRRVERLTCGADAIAALFEHRLTLACSDRASSNLAAERAMRIDAETAGLRTTLAFTPCDIHKIGTCEKATLSLVSSHVSGLVNVGLATRQAGMVASLRGHLMQVFRERLVIRFGPPTHVAARERLYDVLLEDISTRHREEEKQRRAKSALKRKQRLILDRFLNGNLDEHDVVVHYSMQAISREEVLAQFERFVVPALLPGPCPILNRSKFMAFEATATWAALLCAHHNVLQPLMALFHGQPVAAAPQQLVTLGRATPGHGWFGLAQKDAATQDQATRRADVTDVMGSFAVQQLDTDDVPAPGMADDATAAEANITGEVDWGELNRASRKKVAMYAASSPGSTVLVILAMMKPALRLLVRFIGLSSEEFDRRQEASNLSGEPRTYRVVEAAQGRQVNEFFQDISALMHTPFDLLPASSATLAMRGLMFRMLSRCSCAVHQLLQVSHRNTPYALFRALVGDSEAVAEIPPCLQDPLAHLVLSAFPDYSALQSDRAQMILSSVAQTMSIDVLDVEARHASARRLITARSVQTWRLSLSQLNSEWISRQVVILREPWTVVQGKGQKRKMSSQAVKKDRPGKRGGGGPWRAFLYLNARGRKDCFGPTMKHFKVQYQLLKLTQSAEWDGLTDLGFLGTLAA